MKKLAFALIFLCAFEILIGIGFGVLYGVAPDAAYRTIAHRGLSKTAFGNTAEAFSQAAVSSAYGIETDVRFTKDGVIVCHHDAVAEFKNGKTAVIAETDYSELIAEPLLTKDKTPAFIPLFSEYLDICKKGNKVAVVELKPAHLTPSQIDKILTETDEYYRRDMCDFISFSRENLQILRQADKNADAFLLASDIDEELVDYCIANGLNLSAKVKSISKKTVELLHNKNLSVGVWTVDSPAWEAYARICGVDFLTTDGTFIN